MKKILILGAGEMQVPIIQKCNSLGYKTIVTDYSAEAPGLKEANIPLIVDTLDKHKNLQIAKEWEIDGVVTTSDFPVNTVAFICEELNLPGLSVEAAKIGTDKYLQREKVQRNGFNYPRFLKNDIFETIAKRLDELKFPIVIKPVDSSASRGVTKVSELNDTRSAFLEAKKHSKSGNVIIEEFIDGKEYSVESLTQSGKTSVIAITEKSVIQNSDFFVEERHIIPADLSDGENRIIEEYVKDIIQLFKIDNSATHTEIMMSEKGPVLIELGVRLGGDFITSHLVPLSTGVDMQKNIIYLALGKKIETTPICKSFAGVQFIHKDNYEKAKTAYKRKNYFVKAEMKGYSDAPIKSSMDRMGYFIFKEETRERLLEKLDLKLAKI